MIVTGLTDVTAIAAGGNHTVALKNDGTVSAWGYNASGQLGDGGTTDSSTPVVVTGLTGVVTAIAAGEHHTVALMNGGTVYAWGSNNSGRLGDGGTTNSSTPVQVTGLTGVVTAIATGGSHTVALMSGGSVYAWGSNTYGQLGDGGTTSSSTPVAVTGLTNVTAITAGTNHTAALKSDGTVYTWGRNNFYQLGNGNTSVTYSATPVQVTGLTDVTAIAAGGNHTVALKSDGNVSTWGYNNMGKLGNGDSSNSATPVDVRNVVAPTVTGTADSNGTISPASQTITSGQATTLTVTPATGYAIASVSGCNGTSVGVNYSSSYTYATGTVTANCTVTATFAPAHTVVVSAGANGSVGDYSPTASSPVTVVDEDAVSFAISPDTGYEVDTTNPSTTCAVDADFTAAMTSYTTGAVMANCAVSITFALKAYTVDGAVTTVGGGTGGTITINGATVFHGSTTTVTATANTGYVLSGITTDNCGTPTLTSGTTYATDAVTSACTVTATFTETYAVTANTAFGSAQKIAAGEHHTVGLTAEGIVYTWGKNDFGQLGDGTNSDSNVPVQVAGLLTGTVITAIAAGESHTVALTTAGTVYTWGFNHEGGLGDGTNNNSNIPVQATGLLTDTVITAIAAGSLHTVALAANGTLYTWGDNEDGELGDGTTISKNSPVLVMPATAGSNGTITPASQSVSSGDTTTFTVTPDTGYTATVTGCGGTLSGTTYTTDAVTSDCTVTAAFTLNTYTVTASVSGANGTIGASQTVNHGSTTMLTVTPRAGYTATVVGCGGTLSGTTYTTAAITANCAVSATFALNSYTVTATAGTNGTITPASQTVNHGSTTVFTVIPSVGYMATVTGCGGTLSGITYTTRSISMSCAVSATFAQIPPVTHVVTANAGANGAISPAFQTVNHGATTTFTVMPSAGYTATATGCGGTLSGITYTTGAVTTNCAVRVTFVLNTYTVTATAGRNGTITPASQMVNHGSTTVFTVTPRAGYSATVAGCNGTFSGKAYTTGAITANCAVSAQFQPNVYTVTTTGGGDNGIVAPAARQVQHGKDTFFVVRPAVSYTMTVTGCGGTLSENIYKTGAITANCVVNARFKPNIYTVRTMGSGDHGIITPNSRQVRAGSYTLFIVKPITGYTATVTGCGGALSGNVYKTGIIKNDCTVKVQLQQETYTVDTISNDEGGQIAPFSQKVLYGLATTFTVKSNIGYTARVTGCGGLLSPSGKTYRTGPIKGNCTVEATFTRSD